MYDYTNSIPTYSSSLVLLRFRYATLSLRFLSLRFLSLRLNMDSVFHQLSQVMTAVHNLSHFRATHAEVSPPQMNAMIDHALENIMDMLHTTQDFRRDYNSEVRISRHNERLVRARQRIRAEMNAPMPRPRAPAPAPAVRAVRIKKPVSKALKKSDLEAMMPDDCGICLEKNTRMNTASTCCGHHFCVGCYDSMVAHSIAQNRCINCPLCRKVSPQITVFRSRKTPVRKPRNPVLPVIELTSGAEDSIVV